MNHLVKLSVFYYFLVLSANAQRVITQDSIPLYQIRQDAMDQKKNLPSDKGYLANISKNEAGLSLNIFKQSPGYFMVDKATAPKGLESGINYLPGLAQYSFIDGHFKPGKEKVFSLNKGMEKPFEYKFLQVSSTTGGVMTEGNLNLGDGETGGDYSKLLQMMPEALNFKGAEISDNYFYFTKTSEVSFVKYPMAFNPYMGMYIGKNGGVKELKYPIKTDPKRFVGFQAETNVVVYLSPIKKGEFQLFKIDSTGKSVPADKITVPADMDVLNNSVVKEQSSNKQLSFDEIQQVTGVDILFGTAATDYKNGIDYILVRIDKEGKIRYQQAFSQKEDGYVFQSAEVLSNTDEAVVKLTLRKGLLKGALYHIKIDGSGVKYQTRWENDKSVKVITPDGKASSGGASHDSFLVTLTNGENLFGGLNYGINGDAAPSDPNALIGYGVTHLDASGKIKNYYNAKCFVPASLMHKTPVYKWINLGDGKLLLLSKEARDNAGAVFLPFYNLDAAFSNKYNLVVNKADSNIDFVPNPTALGTKSSPFVIGSAVFSSPYQEKVHSQLTDNPVGYSPAFYLIDTKQEKLSRLDMNKQKDYGVYNVDYIWFNQENMRLTTFLQTLPKSDISGKGSNPYPQAVYLKAITMEF